jgi:hypothetical protein
MFAIHAPQSITLTEPGEERSVLLNFHVAGADTSRCVLEIITPAGDTHRLTFSQRGRMVDQQFISHEDAPEGEQPAPIGAADYFVDGRDTRADNPYTHVPPVMHADPLVDYAGGKQPNVMDKDGKPAVNDTEMRKEAVRNAQEGADKRFKEAQERANETPEQRRERTRAEDQERRQKAHEELTNRAGEMAGEPRAKQTGEPARERDGSLSSQKGELEPSRAPGSYDPFAPAPSSPLEGSPLPHRLDSGNPTGSVVNTSESLQNEPTPMPSPNPFEAPPRAPAARNRMMENPRG